MSFVEAVVSTEGKKDTNGSVADNRGKDIAIIHASNLAQTTNTEASAVARDGTLAITLALEDPLRCKEVHPRLLFYDTPGPLIAPVDLFIHGLLPEVSIRLTKCFGSSERFFECTDITVERA